MAELPTHQEQLCFDEYMEDFQEKDFKVDQFISKCRKKVPIECLRRDLDSYYRTLKSAMVELINKDYADFVNLSSNLVGMDKAIEDLITPLTQLEEELLCIKTSMDRAIQAVDGKLTERAQIRKKMETLQRLVDIVASIEKLERLLKVKGSVSSTASTAASDDLHQLSKKAEFGAMVMERIAVEFNKLQYNVSQTDHPIVEDSKPRIAVITSTLQSSLESSLQEGVASNDRSILRHCLQTYASISRCEAAEQLIASMVVYPALEQIITNKNLLSYQAGLSGLYSDILDSTQKRCGLFLQITQATSQAPALVKGYDILVNSVWPQIVSLLEMKVSIIFAQGNPDTFHKNYTTSMEFVQSFEELCATRASVKALRTHPSFNIFMNKWSLPVYFQIRFQDIASRLESVLSLPLIRSSSRESPGTATTPYQLEVFEMVEKCVRQCWVETVFVPALLHRFWKLTLQLLIRVSVWLQHLTKLPLSKSDQKSSQGSGSGQAESLELEDLFCLIHDSELLQKQVGQSKWLRVLVERVNPARHYQVSSIYEARLCNLFPVEKQKVFKGVLGEACEAVSVLVPQFAQLITGGISGLCLEELEAVLLLPRQYRRTNKGTPSRASPYVASSLVPLLSHDGLFPDQYKQEWVEKVISEVTKRYTFVEDEGMGNVDLLKTTGLPRSVCVGRFSELSSELLTSVQRTEESLLKLKSYRKSLAPTSSAGNGGMTDDNKIRLQLALDIEAFVTQALSVHPTSLGLPEFKVLMDQGQTAKTTALSGGT